MCLSHYLNLNMNSVVAGCYAAKNESFKSLSKRLKTFSTWPKGMSQKPADLAKAGFIYTGKADRVICYHCNGGLKQFSQEDVPIKEHLKHYPFCFHAKIISKVVNVPLDVIDGNDNCRDNSNDNGCDVVDATNKIDSKENKDASCCKICLINTACFGFIPCGHCYTCEDCTGTLVDCPFCRTPIIQVLRIYK